MMMMIYRSHWVHDITSCRCCCWC